MNEFFGNIGNWFIENKDTILLWLNGIGTSGIVTAIIAIVKGITNVKSNTVASESLLSSLPIVTENSDKITALIGDVTDFKNNVVDSVTDFKTNITNSIKQLSIAYTEVQNSLDSILMKVNAIIDVEGIKAQTIKNNDTRATVANIVANAKFNETETRAKLLAQLEALKAKAEETQAVTAAQIEEAVAEAKALIEASSAEVVSDVEIEPLEHTVTPRG